MSALVMRTLRLIGAGGGVWIAMTQDRLWAICGGVLLVAGLMQRRTSTPSRDASLQNRRDWTETIRLLVGAALLVGGIVCLEQFSGQSALSGMHELARQIDRGLAVSTAGPNNLSLAGIVGVSFGLLVLGRFVPTFLSPDQQTVDSDPAVELLPRIVAIVAMVRVISHTFSLLDPRAEQIILTLTVITMLLSIARLVNTEEGRAREPLIFSQATISWLATAAVAAWETRNVTGSLSVQSQLPSAISVLTFFIVIDSLALVVTSRPSVAQYDQSRSRRSIPSVLSSWSNSVGRLTLLGLPPLPRFWGRLWLLMACFSVHHHSTLTGLPQAHWGFLALGLLLVIEAVVILAAGLSTSHGQNHFEGRPTRSSPLVSSQLMSALSCSAAVILVLTGLQPRYVVNELCRQQTERILKTDHKNQAKATTAPNPMHKAVTTAPNDLL